MRLASYVRQSRPFFLSQRYWRYEAQMQTSKMLDDPKKLQLLKTQAATNLAQWRKESETTQPKSVSVLNSDWGEVTQALTRRYGAIYAVLTNASAQFAGGAFLNGGSALEENIWLRTTCSSYISEQLQQGDKSQVSYDENAEAFIYKENHSKLIAAQVPMDEMDLQTLRQATGNPTLKAANKTFLNTEQPEVCFRYPETLILQNFESGSMSPAGMEPDPGSSFTMMSLAQVFPFYELRSAALDRSHQANQTGDEAEMKQRIEAQLDTMIVAGVKHATLGAFGCGCYGNSAEMIASLYREAIQARPDCFSHLVFTITKNGLSNNNFTVFSKALHGLPLIKSPSVSSVKLFQAKKESKVKVEEITDKAVSAESTAKI